MLWPMLYMKFAEVGQVIAGTLSVGFLTPNMASKNDTRHDIDESMLASPDAAMFSMFFNAMSSVKKLGKYIPAITCPTSVNGP